MKSVFCLLILLILFIFKITIFSNAQAITDSGWMYLRYKSQLMFPVFILGSESFGSQETAIEPAGFI